MYHFERYKKALLQEREVHIEIDHSRKKQCIFWNFPNLIRRNLVNSKIKLLDTDVKKTRAL